MPTGYQDLRAGKQAVRTEAGVLVQVTSGETGAVRGPAVNHWPVLGVVITPDPKAEYRQVLGGDERAFAYLVAGRLTVGGRTVRAGQLAWTDPVSGQGDPTTRAEIAEAYRDSHSGGFGGIPRHTLSPAGT